MTTTRPSVPRFHVLENALELIRALCPLVAKVRSRSSRLADQIESAASSVAANVAEGNRRVGKDRLHLFRIAAGSADEVRTHLRVAEVWGYLRATEITAALECIDQECAMLWRLTQGRR